MYDKENVSNVIEMRFSNLKFLEIIILTNNVDKIH